MQHQSEQDQAPTEISVHREIHKKRGTETGFTENLQRLDWNQTHQHNPENFWIIRCLSLWTQNSPLAQPTNVCLGGRSEKPVDLKSELPQEFLWSVLSVAFGAWGGCWAGCRLLGWLPAPAVIARVIPHGIAELKLRCIHFFSDHLSRSKEIFLLWINTKIVFFPYNSLSEQCSWKYFLLQQWVQCRLALFTCLWKFNFSVGPSSKTFTNPTETSKPWTYEKFQA